MTRQSEFSDVEVGPFAGAPGAAAAAGSAITGAEDSGTFGATAAGSARARPSSSVTASNARASVKAHLDSLMRLS